MSKPIITLDMKKNRIRIHKCTLKVIDNPEYIYILVNPEKKKIAICQAHETDKDAIKIKTEGCSYCDIYSTELMTQISLLNETIVSNVSYRLFGIERNNCAEFDVRIFQIVNMN